MRLRDRQMSQLQMTRAPYPERRATCTFKFRTPVDCGFTIDKRLGGRERAAEMREGSNLGGFMCSARRQSAAPISPFSSF